MKHAKLLLVSIFAVVTAMSFAGCECEHEWEDATCTSPEICKICGETQGEALEHKWKDATCTEPKTCENCGKTEGDALGHDWKVATCTKPKTCKVCKETEDDALGHDWAKATCTEPKTCKICGETKGDVSDHKWGDWETEKEATCTADGIKVRYCKNCDEKETKVIEAKHTAGEYKVTSPGIKTLYCKVCGAEMRSHSFSESTTGGNNSGSSDGLRSDFKAAMDSYEAFYDKYCSFMKKYNANPSDSSLLIEYLELLEQLADVEEKFDEWENEDLNSEELEYYLEVNTRVAKKLSAIS